MGNKWTIQEWGKLINHNKLNDSMKLENQVENKMEKQNKTDIQVGGTITPETTSRITFITLLFLALNFMIC